MLLGTVPHHNTGGFTSHRKFLPDKEYGEALDTLVKACADMLLVSPDGKKIFVGKRKVQPQPDWWFVGGRVFPGETPPQACCRLLKRELHLDIDPARLLPVCCQSMAWGMREVCAACTKTASCLARQARTHVSPLTVMCDYSHIPWTVRSQQLPKENGTTDSQVVLSLQLTEAEVDKVILDPKEYSDSQWLEPETILSGHYHPALQFAVKSLLGTRTLRQLQQAVAEKSDNDVEIAALARELVRLTAERPADGESAYRVVSEELHYECTVTSQYN